MPTVQHNYDGLIFEWHSDKAEISLKKHGISFDEALTALMDTASLTNEDNRDYDGEQRYITLGVSKYGRLLYVVWTCRDNRYRLISARKANRHETRGYYG